MASTSMSPRVSFTIITSSIIASLAIVVSAYMITTAFIKVKGFGRTIVVTGAAFKPITSDYAIWKGTINVSAATLEEAYAGIKVDIDKTRRFLNKKGFDSGLYHISGVRISKRYNRERQIVGYTLRQEIRIEMADVESITELSKEASSLIEQGVEFESSKPSYLFTKVNDVKIEMIKAATENAKLRAEQLAESTGRKIGAPTSAHVGVFQIRPLNSQAVSGLGINDDSSIEKEIVSTVRVSFLIE